MLHLDHMQEIRCLRQTSRPEDVWKAVLTMNIIKQNEIMVSTSFIVTIGTGSCVLILIQTWWYILKQTHAQWSFFLFPLLAYRESYMLFSIFLWYDSVFSYLQAHSKVRFSIKKFNNFDDFWEVILSFLECFCMGAEHVVSKATARFI